MFHILFPVTLPPPPPILPVTPSCILFTNHQNFTIAVDSTSLYCFLKVPCLIWGWCLFSHVISCPAIWILPALVDDIICDVSVNCANIRFMPSSHGCSLNIVGTFLPSIWLVPVFHIHCCMKFVSVTLWLWMKSAYRTGYSNLTLWVPCISLL